MLGNVVKSRRPALQPRRIILSRHPHTRRRRRMCITSYSSARAHVCGFADALSFDAGVSATQRLAEFRFLQFSCPTVDQHDSTIHRARTSSRPGCRGAAPVLLVALCRNRGSFVDAKDGISNTGSGSGGGNGGSGRHICSTHKHTHTHIRCIDSAESPRKELVAVDCRRCCCCRRRRRRNSRMSSHGCCWCRRQILLLQLI